MSVFLCTCSVDFLFSAKQRHQAVNTKNHAQNWRQELPVRWCGGPSKGTLAGAGWSHMTDAAWVRR